MYTIKRVNKKIKEIENKLGSCVQLDELKKYIDVIVKKDQININTISKINKTKRIKYPYSVFVCTGEKDQVCILAEDKEKAKSKFIQLHRIDSKEMVEVLKLT